jgi:addiction module RelE/StbE family toxin
MVKLNWTSQSKNDLIAIAEFIAQDAKKYARIQLHRIRARARQIAIHPESGRIVPELEDPTIRELILGSYRIVYYIHSKERI